MENSNVGGSEIRMSRVFVLDTNVILHDPNAISSFKGVVVAIPFVVLEELDKFKKENNEKGRNAREAIRMLDELRSRGHLSEGVKLNNGVNSILKVIPNPKEITFSCISQDIHEVKDNLILQTVQDLIKSGMQTTLVTKDINVRVKADTLKIDAEDYTKGKVSYDNYYKGWSRISLPAVDMKMINIKDVYSLIDAKYEIYSNEFVIIENVDNPNQYRLFRFLGERKFKEVQNIKILNAFEAKNIQQLMALDLLMDDNVKLVTLLGPAGTGKTFLALLAGLYKVMHARAYRKLLVARPVIALGADVGFLPGDLQEKLHYWMQPVHDNIEFIYSHLQKTPEAVPEENFGRRRKAKFQEREHQNQDWHMNTHSFVEQLQRKGILSLEAITYMRGRSIPYQFVLIDEVQNLTPHEVKTIVSRAGEGTKVVLAGDPYQIDSPYLDFSSNGLTVTTDRFKEYDIFGSVFLETSERSELAKIAADIL